MLEHPTGEKRIYVKKILNETEENVEKGLEEIKEWLLNQPHLPDTWGMENVLG